MSDSPASKRAKLCSDDKEKEKNGNEKGDLSAVAQSAWEHYRNFVDSVEATQGMMGAEGGDLDELEELLNEILKPYMNKQIQPLASLDQLVQNKSLTIESLLPVLISVVYYHLADSAIAECLEFQEADKSDKSNNNNNNKDKQTLITQCQQLIEKSIHWYPQNAAMWSMAANFGRMLQVLRPSAICTWYQNAAECALQVQQVALPFLQQDDTDNNKLTKEWIELLLLNQVCAIDYVGDEEEEDDDHDHGKKENNEEDLTEKDEEDDNGYFSSSAVEATSRFMAAMLLSTVGKQKQALKQLEKFPITHRIHPNVWQPNANTNNNDSSVVVQYRAKDKGVLPQQLYDRICRVFAPKAGYWTESDYNHRGYYSYFRDMPETKQQDQFVVSNVIDDVIWNHLYPLVLKQQQQRRQQQQQQQQKQNQQSEEICGAEWWVHTRPVQANLGHNLHFDTDEALLLQEGEITHPIYSSVLYLTGGKAGGGATIVLDQTPNSEEIASKVWRCVPQDNTLLVFPGNLLHGVLPCPGIGADKGEPDDIEKKESINSDVISKAWTGVDHNNNTKDSIGTGEKNHRLTFLVGFWTRKVPEKMKKIRLYGPCGPLPPRPVQEPENKASKQSEKKNDTDDNEEDEMVHKWVDEIHQGYDEFKPQSAMDTVTSSLPCISPAWDRINNNTNNAETDPHKLLEIPKPIDHRFFVADPPQCFRDSLFERDEEDDDDDEVEMVEVVSEED
ncbi:Inherit from virNOG: HhH-GPD superfamily base excision DNA repair protein [Seminavis robusta]|uniref:Inherit from virNOG: HhH-GPD superfamily base excision DNA repair protein n=1 Tax=Seminavis robusta TaxID=568900 RepID=A0A9N8HJ88_9STRA|nr:Inherit from virNOG: HhH-GPD superfamily base excision DNA repair protein [Seminavis robusta]|eukprot:Sro749_g196780.1 Inherit from virNOG: HhH-GPD superfamily base excision DNA repair protein (729) ;mRNA; r:14206-16465